MKEPLVVLTYPGHFLLTALTLKSYCQYHTPGTIVVLVDDTSPWAWPGYVNDCQQLYQIQIKTTSQLKLVQAFQNNPWVRQQIIKLHLDQVVEFDRWFFSDGDMTYNFAIPENITPFTVTSGGLVQEQQNRYVFSVLKLAQAGIEATFDRGNGPETKQVCVSNPPFRFMQAKTLQHLRQHVEQLHGKRFCEVHEVIMNHDRRSNNPVFSISEWELIANFQRHVQNNELNLQYYPTYNLGDSMGILAPNQPDYVHTCFNSDKDFGQTWFESQGITIEPRIWDYLSKINK
jgi:hypothetical protein